MSSSALPRLFALGAGAVAALLFAGRRRSRRATDERRAALTDRWPREQVEEMHARKVRRIVAELAGIDHGPVALRKRVVSHEVPRRGDAKYSDRAVDVGDLTAILHIDPERRICVAESGVTFEDLVAATLPHGLVPVVVPELKTITIGGAVTGCSLESTSHRYGGFHDNCLEYEVVTTDGRVLTCTPDGAHALVFQMIHGSFGTLGVLTRLTFRLLPARPHVRLRHEHYTTLSAYLAAIRGHFERGDVEFMDGIIHAPDRFALSTGEFVDTVPYLSHYDWLAVYYPSTWTRDEDYLTTAEYFFRYDRGVTNVWPRTRVGRALFGKLLPSDRVLRVASWFNRFLRRDRPMVTLDTFIPISRAPEFLAWYAREFDYYPLWCVPYRRVRDYEWISRRWYAGIDDPLFLDLAIYGMQQRDGRNYHRLMEEELMRVNGIKTLISHNYYSEEEFWSIWNRDNWRAVKAITDPRNLLRDLYDRTCRAARGLS